MTFVLGAALLWSLWTPFPAFGQTSCLPATTALNALLEFDPARPVPARLRLHGDSLVDLDLSPDSKDPGVWNMTLEFAPDFDGVSLPYNLYALLVLVDGQARGWWDYTRACAGPGLGFFPGQSIRLPALKLVGARPARVQIMVWGRL